MRAVAAFMRMGRDQTSPQNLRLFVIILLMLVPVMFIIQMVQTG